MSESDVKSSVRDGFAVGYAKDKGSFRVFVTSAFAIVFGGAWFYSGSEIALALSVFFAVTAYYFFPLVETSKARLGAGQYGLFIEGFGIVPWRSVDDIKLSTYAVRTIQVNELHIKLSRSLPSALMADWRSLPYYRLLMKLPWSMSRDNVVRVNLEPFAGEPDDIVAALQRNWRMFGTV